MIPAKEQGISSRVRAFSAPDAVERSARIFLAMLLEPSTQLVVFWIMMGVELPTICPVFWDQLPYFRTLSFQLLSTRHIGR
jgi:hypothetical protein